jgi:hypothetical protein
MMNRSALAAVLVVASLSVGATACARSKRPALQPSARPEGATLWERPGDLGSRDLFIGPWGREHAPDPRDTFTYVERKRSGVNLGMTVVDSKGREWSVKQPYPGVMDDESPVEVTLSRILSAVGYHQPPVYYLPEFILKDDWGTHVEPGGRFRLKLESLKDAGPWSWAENPFIGSKPYNGLLVMLMMFNDSDLKNSNNTLYEYTRGGKTERLYVVRDIGASLGDIDRFAPRKNNIDAFEKVPFILGTSGGHVELVADPWYRKLVRDRITPEDVRWASDLLAQLSDRQWREAFRAGGYDPNVASRFIRKLRSKVDQGREVTLRADAR